LILLPAILRHGLDDPGFGHLSHIFGRRARRIACLTIAAPVERDELILVVEQAAARVARLGMYGTIEHLDAVPRPFRNDHAATRRKSPLGTPAKQSQRQTNKRATSWSDPHIGACSMLHVQQGDVRVFIERYRHGSILAAVYVSHGDIVSQSMIDNVGISHDQVRSDRDA
jgi:hypothetical protein